MKAFYKSGFALLMTSCGLFAQALTPQAVVNPASNIPTGYPNAGIAQGSIFVVYGKNMGGVTLVQAPSLPLPTTGGLAGTSVQVTVGSTTATAPMIYTSATQIAGVLPSSVPPGTGTLAVTFNGQTASIPILVVASNFGISTVSQTGSGPAVVTFPSYALVTTTNSAKPGDTLLLWGTGLGPITGSDAGIPSEVDLGTAVKVYVGGQAATVTYRGRSGAPGLDQINFVVPAGVSGCYVSLVVQTGNTVSNTTTTAVSPSGGACSDSNGISLSSLSGALGKGTVSVGSVVLTQTAFTISIGGQNISTSAASGTATFTRFTAAQIASSPNLFGIPSAGSCTVYNFTGATPPNIGAVQALGLDAGSAITVTPPAGIPISLTQGFTGLAGSYGATLPSALTAGTYGITNGSGGVDVKAFTASLKIPPPLTWTNQAAITTTTAGLIGTVNRAQPLTITWSGGDPNSFASIIGFSTTSSSSSSLGGFFLCSAPIAPQQFTVPSAVLLALPPTTVGTGLGILLVGSATTPQAFTATGLDFAFASADTVAGASLLYQ